MYTKCRRGSPNTTWRRTVEKELSERLKYNWSTIEKVAKDLVAALGATPGIVCSR